MFIWDGLWDVVSRGYLVKKRLEISDLFTYDAGELRIFSVRGMVQVRRGYISH